MSEVPKDSTGSEASKGEWVRVADSAEVVMERPYGVAIGADQVVLLRTATGVKAYQGACPHAGGPLHKGRVVNGRLVCPKHGWSFEAETGRRGNVCLRTLLVEERDDGIWLQASPGLTCSDGDFPGGRYARLG